MQGITRVAKEKQFPLATSWSERCKNEGNEIKKNTYYSMIG